MIYKILYHPKPGTTGFFLIENVMEELKESDFSIKNNYQLSSQIYNERLQACKEEAIKNGEVTNPEFCAIEMNDNWWTRKSILNDLLGTQLKPGDTFDLPKGLKVEREYNHVEKSHGVESYSFIRLVPDVEEQSNAKEESQEELIAELISKYRKMRKTGATIYSIELNLIEDFTIQRKSK